ncbi:Putative metal chaperone, involved in Zn homeostasis, GTPase of COG0523 family [Methanosarcina lacustris Z-7289]|uniref:Putative metal chaperone, involved in Zn homeostasis, GTPase of COG0523 family n=1 Tax=Methanosarcina lacustris Z-7289 TaxID=1434111 RepID=A0A0E3SAG7_9EURY|nr:GTP-binding protein [Methanosarcina lacustris]AKB76218.1 Putative metal chaperone, involved in Zn homeostasis, GTPase of COG0523 family [Methanosarcina lacustris Z-7289]
MKCMIIGGFLGSGKTTTIKKLVEYLGTQGQRTAIIVNEIGEVGIDGDTFSEGGVETREITNGCVCCTLRISMEYTIKNLITSYHPDTIIIEPTGIAFPRQIKSNIESMGLPDIRFTPIVNLVDPRRLNPDAGDLQNFVRNQIEDAEVLGINKVDLIGPEKLLETCLFLRKLNPKARIVHFSAKQGGEALDNLFCLIRRSSQNKTIHEARNSVEMSGVSAYSTEFEIISQEIPLETVVSVSGQILDGIRNRVTELNPEFTGHIKLSFAHKENFVKGSVTSAYDKSEIEILKKERNSRSRIKILSAVTSVPIEELIKTVDTTVSGQLEDRQLSYIKVEKNDHGYRQVTISPLMQRNF